PSPAPREPTALTRPRAAVHARAGAIHSAQRSSPERGSGLRRAAWGLVVLAVAVGAGLALDDRLRALVGIEVAQGPEIQQAQPEDKVVWLTRSEPRWFSVVVEGADPEQPPQMRWYLNDVLVAEGTTMWEYDPAKNLQDLTSHGEVRFLLGTGRLPGQSHIWATQTAAKDLSPVLQSASYKPGSTITAAVGDTVVIEVDAIDPDGSPLTYTWRVDGKRVGGNAPRLELQARRDAKITLAISDGGAVVSSSWGLAIGSGKP
ncbi:hypothetical protein K2Z84_19070, partial [Candidatus Binatia bacterium]|nr:hypothetical protein [Candidatus Binatia bacterium]